MKYFAIFIMALGLTACTVTAKSPDRITIDRDGVVTIDNSRKNNNKNSYKHCPPGQAKKGNC